MSEVLIPAIIFFSIVAIVKIVSDNKIKNRLIEKGVEDTKPKRILESSVELHALSSLKWGMVLVGIGLAAFISELFPRYQSDEVLIGLIFLFAGIAFLVYYGLAEKRVRQIKKRNSEET